MNSFRDKNFKNSLDPYLTSYECIRNCEIQRSKEQSLEICLISCEWPPPTKDPTNEKHFRKACMKRSESYTKFSKKTSLYFKFLLGRAIWRGKLVRPPHTK